MRRSPGWRLLAGLVALACLHGSARAVDAAPAEAAKAAPEARVFYTQRGQFEIVVQDAVDAQSALALGRSVWRALSAPLGLPREGFATPVTIRLVPAAQWTEPSPFTVTVEPGGWVGVRVRWAADSDPLFVRRAFVQGLILRQAVAWHAVGPRLTVPLWLEQACTAWSLVSERPAMMDAFQQESAGVSAPPSLRALLLWERGAVESRGWELASLWLFLQLQAEPGEPARWGRWIRGVVGGASPVDTLPRSYAGLWADAAMQELWWQTTFHHQRRLQSLPVMSAASSRSWMADRSRWLAGREGREVVLPLGELHALRREPWVRSELQVRIGQIQSVLGALHPYYTNAAISMGRLYEVALKGSDADFKTAVENFERDAIDGRELEDTVGAILDTAPRK